MNRVWLRPKFIRITDHVSEWESYCAAALPNFSFLFLSLFFFFFKFTQGKKIYSVSGFHLCQFYLMNIAFFRPNHLFGTRSSPAMALAQANQSSWMCFVGISIRSHFSRHFVRAMQEPTTCYAAPRAESTAHNLYKRHERLK